MNSYRLLIVEDDASIASSLCITLKSMGYDCRRVTDFSNVLEAVRKDQPDLVLMDFYLPYHNGVEWTELIRKESQVPILFITSADDPMYEVSALIQGADDYVTKPFDLSVLCSRIEALIRRSTMPKQSRTLIEYNSLSFEPESARVTFNGHSTELSRNESRILKVLMEAQGAIVSREKLMDYLWQTDIYIDENTLTVNVNRLRRKLETIGVKDFIRTHKGAGYSL